MKMANYPLSAMLEGARSAAGGGFTFALGVIGGTLLALFITLHHFTAWYWYPIATVFLVPYAMYKLWGLLLMPLYGVLFYGLVWSEWNRVLCFAILAMATSLVMLISFGENPLSESGTAWRFLIVEGILGALLIGSALLERARSCPTKGWWVRSQARAPQP